jgi:exfoliative toxin A/B
MRKYLERLPYPIAGVMLAYAALGNLLEAFLGADVKYLCGMISALILLLMIVKILVMPKSFEDAMGVLPIASVIATAPMGIMLLAVYLKGLFGSIAVLVWMFGLIVNVYIIFYFTIKHGFPFKKEKIFASYYVTYVGVVVASVTAKAFGMISVGIISFVFGLLSFIVLLPIVTYRYIIIGQAPAPLKPLIVIYGAPANLLLVGYLSLGLTWSDMFVYILWGIGIVTTIFAWSQIIVLRNSAFYPSFSAYTFPLTIGAMATMRFNAFLVNQGEVVMWLKILGQVQSAIAIVAVIYVTICYIKFVLGVKDKKSMEKAI